ncbi:MAG: DUF2027 domain-containing protein [Cyclobacteriaceae bacterium]|nr:DUF2027 domain-containing protein [Cyclobacteriaceae bacterium]
MRIGDRVRLLRGTEEGIIVNIKGDKIVEVEIEDGFIIPAMKNEVVVIDKNESGVFSTAEKTLNPPQYKRSNDQIPSGLYLGLAEKNENRYQAYFINQLSEVVLFSISQNDKRSITGKGYGICKGYESVEIGEMTSGIFNSSKRLNVQVIFHENQVRLKKNPLNIDLNLSKEKLTKKVLLGSIDEEIFLVKIEEKAIVEIDPEKLKEKLFESSEHSYSNKENKIHSKEQTIDLHIDELSINLKNNEILEYQLNEFEKAYDDALLLNLEKLKIIHGVGAGILRNEIHKRLSVRKEIKFFEDADKERFGFGSTIIYF